MRVRGAVVDLGGFLGGWVGLLFVGFWFWRTEMWNGGWKKLKAFFMEMEGREKGWRGADGKRMVGMKRGVRM